MRQSMTTLQPRLKSNGFGSHLQNIIIHVNNVYIEDLINLTGNQPIKKGSCKSKICWNRKSTKRLDDEDIVFELDYYLDNVPISAWEILWDESEY